MNAATGSAPARSRPLRVGVVVSHPIQHFGPWFREAATLEDLQLKVFFGCDWGIREYEDPGFGKRLAWNIPLTEGYDHEFLRLRRRPRRLSFWALNNLNVESALEAFGPDVLLVFGYVYRTNWKPALGDPEAEARASLFGFAVWKTSSVAKEDDQETRGPLLLQNGGRGARRR